MINSWWMSAHTLSTITESTISASLVRETWITFILDVMYKKMQAALETWHEKQPMLCNVKHKPFRNKVSGHFSFDWRCNNKQTLLEQITDGLLWKVTTTQKSLVTRLLLELNYRVHSFYVEKRLRSSINPHPATIAFSYSALRQHHSTGIIKKEMGI